MDEDTVIVEGTPLAEYLKGVGMYELVEEVESEVKEIITPDPPFIGRVWEFMKALAVKAFKPTIIRDCYDSLCIRKIVEAELLDDFDITPLMEERGLHPEFSESILTWCVLKRGFCDAMFALLPAAAVWMIQKRNIVVQTLAFTPAVGLLIIWRPLIMAHIEYRRLRSYLGYLKIFHDDLQKATRAINETSLINRGYMLNAQTCASAWRLETPNTLAMSRMLEKSLPGLRIAVMHTTSRLAVEYCIELRKQRELRPLPFYLDHPLLSTTSLDDVDNGHEDGDIIPSLVEIKKSLEEYLIKEQEHLKRMVIGLVSQNCDEEFRIPLSGNIVSSLMDSVKELKLSYIFYKTIFLNKGSCRLKKLKEKKSMTRLDMFHCMWHSAKGHLEEALRVAACLEESLEDSSIDPLSVSPLMTLVLNKTNFHVESTKECLEKASLCISNLGCKTVICSNVVPGNAPEKNIVNGADDVKVRVCAPPPTDEIFEFFGEKTLPEDPPEDILGRRATKLERESSQLVLQELKNVLRVKALDWERREMKIKERRLAINISDENNLGKDCCEGPVERNDLALSSSSSSVNTGDQASSSLSSWVIAGAGDPGITSALNAAPQEEVEGFDRNMIGSLATEAVAKAKLNQMFGVLTSSEDEYVLAGED